MQYKFSEIEAKWQKQWREKDTFKVVEDESKPKFYVLDMFPYPSGSGLHVGHPLGYIASDIYSRYKNLNGFNVLHPMGYDAFGLPAEQYAIETGQHPAITTKNNIQRYREQLDKIGFSYDWSREIKTTSTDYYEWTQWIFIQLFNSWYDKKTDKAQSISKLIELFEKSGNKEILAASNFEETFTAEEWKAFDEKKKSEILLQYRLAYQAETMVNWCPALGTVLANDEVKDGKSERGNHPVVQKRMKQWCLRISAYAERLLQGLEQIDWSDSIKDIQRNWIGKSTGAEVLFPVKNSTAFIKVFTTRVDTIFGVTFMVLAPEHELVNQLCTENQKAEVKAYQEKAAAKSELDRISETKEVSGAFTGAFALNPLNGTEIPIFISDYVLAGYGTGAIMAVPGGDNRDWRFAKHFDLPIICVNQGEDVSEGAFEAKEGILANSEFLNGLEVKAAMKKAVEALEAKGLGKEKVNYKMRDAIFGRQRYWGEPIPIYYDEKGIPNALDFTDLPLNLPEIEKFLPTEEGEPPLARAKDWKYKGKFDFEWSTMPGWAGSSWYYLRYMSPKHEASFVDEKALNYWKQIDLYLGGAEHATGHLLYFRFWTKVLFDLGFLPFDEPAKKLINQGMILAEDGQKMSKRYNNVVNPDDVIAQYGADALRLHEMFLGPIEQHKPWNTKGIEGVSRFLRKFWNLYFSQDGDLIVENTAPSKEELKVLHTAIKAITEDNERFSFNTVVSKLMVCVNELGALKCHKKAVLEKLLILAVPHAPYITEELWECLGNSESITKATWPEFNSEYLVEDSITYPVMFNGKLRFKMEFPAETSGADIERQVREDERMEKWLEGKAIKKMIVVPKKVVNVVA